jgi:hypothetical protein
MAVADDCRVLSRGVTHHKANRTATEKLFSRVVWFFCTNQARDAGTWGQSKTDTAGRPRGPTRHSHAIFSTCMQNCPAQWQADGSARPYNTVTCGLFTTNGDGLVEIGSLPERMWPARAKLNLLHRSAPPEVERRLRQEVVPTDPPTAHLKIT